LRNAGLLNLGWAAAQGAAGFALGSASLLSDAVHNLGDAAGLVLAWGAAALAVRQASDRRTWGWHRAEPLAAWANSLLVLAGAAAVAAGAGWRLFHPAPLNGLAVSLWALAGIAVNGVSAGWIGRGSENVNTRGAYLHLVADAAVSGAVVVAGLVVRWTGQSWIDPVLALLVSAWLVHETWPLLRESLGRVVDAVPEGLDAENVAQNLSSIPGVVEVHDLHLWPLGGDRAALTAHLVHSPHVEPSQVLREALDRVHHAHPSIHPTFQVEPETVDEWHGHGVCAGRE
jgi:cobalt-zinc-cadmium efflux system protein